MKKINFNFLNKKYPLNSDLKHNIKIIFVLSLGIFLFLLFFLPFDLDNLRLEGKISFIVGFGSVTFISLSLNLLLLPVIFKKAFNSAKWNIKKEIIWNFCIFSTISLGYFFYYTFIGNYKLNFYLILKLNFLALIPISLLITINQERLLRTHIKLAKQLNKKLEEKKVIEKTMVHFNSDYQKDNLSIKIYSLLFIRAANNYIEIFWKEKKNF